MRIVKCFDLAQKKEIYRLRNSGVPQVDVARDLNVSVDTIRRIEKEMRAAELAPAKTPVAEAIAKVQKKAQSAVIYGGQDGKPTKVDIKCDGDVKVVVKAAVVKAKPKLVWTMGENYINIVDKGVTFVANDTHPNFAKAREAIFKGNVEEALNLINVKRGIDKYTKGKIRIENEEVFYGNLKIDSGLTRRIIEAMGEGKDFKHLVNFFENLMLNPSFRAVQELYGFLQHNDIELTEDGHFIAWKRVDEKFMDMYTGTMDNSPGKVVEVPRNMVDENSDRTCSNGLHVAAKSYLPHYGGGRGKVISCKVNPRDVVAIPRDYNNAKMRCSRYEVMEDVTEGFSHY